MVSYSRNLYWVWSCGCLASKWPGDQFLPLSCTFLANTFKMIPLACIVPCQKHLLIVAIVTQGTVPSLLVSVRRHCTIQRMRIGLYDLHPLGRALSGFVTFLQQIMTIHLLLLTHSVFLTSFVGINCWGPWG